MDHVTSERLAEWHLIWRGAGPDRIAEELASGAMGKFVDEIGGAGADTKRDHARAWLAQYQTESDRERRRTNLRSWIAIVLAGISLVVTIVGLFIRAKG